jgi:hypothetical protein
MAQNRRLTHLRKDLYVCAMIAEHRANDVHDAGEIVGKDVQRHLGCDAL